MSADRPSLLIVTMGLDSVAPARMPRELKAAGFSVTLLAPREALATHTRFVDRLGYFPERATLFDWVQTLMGAVRATRPRLVLPGDEIALRVLVQLSLEPPAGLVPAVRQELADLVAASLGDPARYLETLDKTRMMAFARELGVHVPPGEPVDDENSAVKAAAALGYPVIVKPAYGTGGVGVVRCENPEAVRTAMRELPRAEGWAPAGSASALVQRMLTGTPTVRTCLAWKGREIAGFTRRRIRSYPEPMGPASVGRHFAHAGIAEANRRLLEALGANGFLGNEFLIEETTGQPHLIEINRRMIPPTHTGGRVGVNLASALFAVINGRQWDGATDLAPGEEPVLALFPQEWLRDPGSDMLQRLPSDAPWDDPELFTAMLHLPESAKRWQARAAGRPA